MDPAEAALAARRTAAWSRLGAHGVVRVAGADRVRWLDGMLTCEVARLARSGGCGTRALALTRKGQIVADVRVWVRSEGFWLETERAAIPGLLAHLRRHLAADDVELADASQEIALFAVEGPRAPDLLAGSGAPRPGADAVAGGAVAGAQVEAAGWGVGGQGGFRVACAASDSERVETALAAAAGALGAGCCDAAALDILRIEAGEPAFGSELERGLLPGEARLERAISFGKGCYVGQEIVARIASRATLRRFLVGVRLGGAAEASSDELRDARGEVVGCITSRALSARLGPIGLALVQVPHDAVGTELRVDHLVARVSELPFATTDAADRR